ncbi:ATP12 family protein [Sphingomonas sp.]|uniref:ATP12 family chaperone protein n=1 Tax=Sphingomonas sp. TaxID=28214 RepID=UPI001B23A9BB|nr:ATP12 family protein [Sphingomonas sp.]MBO9714486.1 ATPase [Sphingomonas sp.]
MRRFWKDIAVEETAHGHALRLDGRLVRTPGRAELALPTPQLAAAIAGEWHAVAETIDPRAMPLTGLANAAIDRVAPDRARFAASLAAYGESDLTCYRAAEPPPLVERQAEHWDPLLDWARGRYDVHFETVAGVIHKPQPPATIARLGEAVGVLDAFHLAGLSPLVTVSGSLLIGLALLEGAVSRDVAWAAALVDEAWQAEQWGEDELATLARESKRGEFDAGARFLGLL